MGVLRKHDEHTVLPERHARDEEAKAKRRTSERRKKRLPVPSDDLPSLKRPAATTAYGIVVVTEIMGELVNAEETAEHHSGRRRRACLGRMAGGDAGRTRPHMAGASGTGRIREAAGMVAADDRGAAAARSAARSRERRRNLREQVDETLP